MKYLQRDVAKQRTNQTNPDTIAGYNQIHNNH